MRALRLAAASALTLLALVACSNEPSTPVPQTTTTTPDTGVAACEAALESYESGDDSSQVPPQVIADLKSSGNADLQAVGVAFEEYSSLSEDEILEQLDEILAALSRFGQGCAAVGVELPDEMLGGEPTE
jgi:hypothetical protein